MLPYTLFFLILTVTVVSCNNVRIFDLKACGEYTFKSLSVTGCDERDCFISNGKTYVLNMTFVANQNTKTFRGVTWVFNNGTADVLGDYDTDGCANNDYIWLEGGRCPLRKGRTYSLIIVWTPTDMTIGTKPAFIGLWRGDNKNCDEMAYAIAMRYTIVK